MRLGEMSDMKKSIIENPFIFSPDWK